MGKLTKEKPIETSAYRFRSQLGDMVVFGRATPLDNGGQAYGQTMAESILVPANARDINGFLYAIEQFNKHDSFWRALAPCGMRDIIRDNYDICLPADFRASYVNDPYKYAPIDVYGNWLGVAEEKFKRHELCTDILQAACIDLGKLHPDVTLGGIVAFGGDKRELAARRAFYESLDFDFLSSPFGLTEHVTTRINHNKKLQTQNKFIPAPGLANRFSDALNK